MRVLVFPACNEPGLEVIDALDRHPRVTLFGASSVPREDDPALPLLGDRLHALPMLHDPGFLVALRELIVRLDIEAVFPTVDAVVAALSHADLSPAIVIGPSPEVAELVLSKSRVAAALTPHVAVARDFDPSAMSLPAFVKPDIGSGSRGATIANDVESVSRARADGLLVLEHLPGAEYTVDCVGDRDGRLLAASVRRRGVIAGGIARTTTCVRHPEIEAAVRTIADRLTIAGPWFAQFKEDRDGTPRLLEVNARVGGSSGASRLAGVNVPLMAVLAFSGFELVAPRRLETLTVVRRLDRSGDVDDFDWVVWDLDDTLVDHEGCVVPEVAAWLFRLHNAKKRQLLLSRNRDPAAVVEATKLPNFFVEIVRADDKVMALRGLLDRYAIDPTRCVMINDSNSERLVFERELPAIRTFAPDAIGALRP